MSTPAPERSPCPVGASCGEVGSEVGSIKGLADAGRCRTLCAVHGGFCARCCAVLSTYVANGDAVGNFGWEAPARQRPPQPPCGLLGAKLHLPGLEGSPRQTGGVWSVGWPSCCEPGALGPRCKTSGAARLLRTALSCSTLVALSRQPASPSRERRGALPRE
jgi:hypothetical protein